MGISALTNFNKVRWQYRWTVVGNTLMDFMLKWFLIITEKEWRNSAYILQSYKKTTKNNQSKPSIVAIFGNITLCKESLTGT